MENHETVSLSTKPQIVLPDIKKDTYNGEISRLSKGELEGIVGLLSSYIETGKVRVSPDSAPGMRALVTTIQSGRRNLFKEEMIELYYSFCSRVENVRVIATLSKKIMATWKMLIDEAQVSSEDIESVLGRNLGVAYTTTYWSSFYFVESFFAYLSVVRSGRFYSFYNKQYRFNFTLLPEDRRALVKTFFGDNFLEPLVVDNLPVYENLVIDNFEKNMPSDMAFLMGMKISGSPLGANKTLSVAKLKSVKKQLTTPEFYPRLEEWPVDRIEFLVTAYFLQKSKDLKLFARNVVENIPKEIVGAQFGMFLPSFKSFNKAWADDSNIRSFVKVVNSLLLPAAKGWMSLSNFRMRILCADWIDKDTTGYFHLFPNTQREKSSLKRKNEKLNPYETRSKGIDWFKEVDFPFALHWMKLLCAVGILEIAGVESPKLDENDELEGMRYVRLTPLGRYAFSIDKTYESALVQDGYSLEFDDPNGIFTVVGENCPYVEFLKKITMAISNTRYRITTVSLLKGCADINDLEERISNLKRIIKVKDFPKLQEMFVEARRRTDCLLPLDGSYVVIKLRRDVPGLIPLITGDGELRKLVILAENSMMLIKKENFDNFRQICAKNGYLI